MAVKAEPKPSSVAAFPGAELLAELDKRGLVERRHFIMMGGEPTEVKLPGTIHWSALASAFPALATMIRGEALPIGMRQAAANDVRMQAETIAVAIALCFAEEGQINEMSVRAFTTRAQAMAPTEREDGFVYIFHQSFPHFKKSFDQAVVRAAEELKADARGTGANRKARRAAKAKA